MVLISLIYTLVFIFVYRAELTLDTKLIMGLIVMLIISVEFSKYRTEKK